MKQRSTLSSLSNKSNWSFYINTLRPLFLSFGEGEEKLYRRGSSLLVLPPVEDGKWVEGKEEQ